MYRILPVKDSRYSVRVYWHTCATNRERESAQNTRLSYQPVGVECGSAHRAGAGRRLHGQPRPLSWGQPERFCDLHHLFYRRMYCRSLPLGIMYESPLNLILLIIHTRGSHQKGIPDPHVGCGPFCPQDINTVDPRSSAETPVHGDVSSPCDCFDVRFISHPPSVSYTRIILEPVFMVLNIDARLLALRYQDGHQRVNFTAKCTLADSINVASLPPFHYTPNSQCYLTTAAPS